MTSETKGFPWLKFASIGLVVITAVVLYYRDPIVASNLEIIPDSVEYACGGYRIASAGLYELQINGEPFPPRYSPWFSMLFIAPAYSILGFEPGNAIIPIFLMAILGVLAAYWIGTRLAGPWGGCLASLFVFIIPLYSCYAKNVMTDVPTSALLLLTAALFLYMKDNPRHLAVLMLPTGVICAIIISLRPATMGVTIPFLCMAMIPAWRRRALLPLLFLTGPILLFLALGLMYNYQIFGDAFRTGYHFWCPVPYDYTSLTFSLHYVSQNLMAAHAAQMDIYLGIMILLTILLHRKSKRSHSPVPAGQTVLPYFFFTLAVVLPLLAFHMVYFFPTDRFFLPVITLLTVLNGVLLARLIPYTSTWMPLAVQALVFAAFLIINNNQQEPVPTRRLAAEKIRQLTPENAWIVTTLDPVYVDLLLGTNNLRRIIPLSRNVEYASKLIAWKKIPHPVPPPENWQDHFCEGLILGGAREALSLTASEHREILVQALQNGIPLFLEAGSTDPRDAPLLQKLETEFQIRPKVAFLSEITFRNTPQSSKEDGLTKEASPLQGITGTQTSPAIQPAAHD